MEYTIKPLSPELAATFTGYFNSIDFGHAPHWSTCYCRFYQANCTYEEWQNRTGEKNRLEAIDEIRAGNMKGYLAFNGDLCIGWCNANDANQYVRLKEDINHIIAGKKIGCVICFAIHLFCAVEGSNSLV